MRGGGISFRTKIALLAEAITGGIIVGACWLLWSMTYRFNLDTFDARMAHLKWGFYWVTPLALILAFSGAWIVARRSLRPVEELTLAVEGLTAQALDQRIELVGHEREFRRLVEMFNAMMGRMEKSFHMARRFSADASHELKTPLARLQMKVRYGYTWRIKGGR